MLLAEVINCPHFEHYELYNVSNCYANRRMPALLLLPFITGVCLDFIQREKSLQRVAITKVALHLKAEEASSHCLRSVCQAKLVAKACKRTDTKLKITYDTDP